jgi:predicted nucleotide-binding protein
LDARRAADELRKLRRQADTPEVQRSGAEHKAWKAKVAAIMQEGLGKDSGTLQEFNKLRYSVGFWSGAPGEAQRDAQFFAKRVRDAVGFIDAAIYQLELQDDSSEARGMAAGSPTTEESIFIVHGHDDGRKSELLRLLEKAAELPAVVLHERPNRGATILEKFEKHAYAARFAIVLLTGDDEGRLRDSGLPLTPRGRQNVILELGVFIGSLGRENVVVLKDSDVEEPSDLHGLVYIPLDSSGAWKYNLLRELKEAGIKVDFEKIPLSAGGERALKNTPISAGGPLTRGWFDDDSGISHAVDSSHPDRSLCGKLNPFRRQDIREPWITAPSPRCQRCERAAQEYP